jgi:hypothetical protein
MRNKLQGAICDYLQKLGDGQESTSPGLVWRFECRYERTASACTINTSPVQFSVIATYVSSIYSFFSIFNYFISGTINIDQRYLLDSFRLNRSLYYFMEMII